MSKLDLIHYKPYVHLKRLPHSLPGGVTVWPITHFELRWSVACPKNSFKDFTYGDGGKLGKVIDGIREIIINIDGQETGKERIESDEIMLPINCIQFPSERAVKVITELPEAMGGSGSTTVNYEDADDEE